MLRSLRRYWWVGLGLVALVAGGLVLFFWRSAGSDRALPPARARVYQDFDTCLLTGATGLADERSAAVWNGIRDATTPIRVRASYLSVAGPDTVANALPYARSLVARKCRVIVAVGSVEVTAVRKLALDYGDIRFLVVGAGDGGGNVSVVGTGEARVVRRAVAKAVSRLVLQ